MLKKILKKINFLKKNEFEKNIKNSKITDKTKSEENKNQGKSDTPDDIYPLW